VLLIMCQIINKQKKLFWGLYYHYKKYIGHDYYIIGLGKFMPFSEGTNFMVRYRCNNCGIEQHFQFEDWEYLNRIGVPNTILKEYNDLSFMTLKEPIKVTKRW
jgi:hypothetical protein